MRRFLDQLHEAFHVPGTQLHAVVEGTVWSLIALSVGLFGVELFAGWHGATEGDLVRLLDRAILWLFVAEYALRVLTYRPPALKLFRRTAPWRIRTHVLGRLRFCLRPLQLIDLLTVLALVPALRGLRALRLLRLLRTVRLFRYSNPVSGVLRSFQENALLYSATFSFLVTTVVVGGLSLYLAEGPANEAVGSLGDAIWWALVTITTVGYGDVTPVTAVGRVIGGSLMVAGMFTLALFAGIVGSTLLQTFLSLRKDQFRMSGFMNHIVVCGYDAGARMFLDVLLREVDPTTHAVVVFGQGERPPELAPEFAWISGDPTKESELDKVRMQHASTVILVGSRGISPQQADATTLLAVFTIRSYLRRHETTSQRRKPVYVVAEILDAENVDHARSAGADEVIETTRLGFSLLAHAVHFHGAGEVMSSVASAGAHSLYIGKAPFDEPRAFAEVAKHVKARHGAILIGVRRAASGAVELGPRDETELSPDDGLVYLARHEVLPRL